MRYCEFRELCCCAAILGAMALAGCGDSCFFGFSSNGKGGVAVAAGNLPPACPSPRMNGAVRVLALKSQACETCARAVRAEHIFVTVKGVELGPNSFDQPGDWLEIAPELETEPRQIDLLGDGLAETLVDSRAVPAGGYRQLRLQFFPDSGARTLPAESSCGGTLWNCTVLAGGGVEPIRLPGDGLLVAIESPAGGPVAVLPDAGMDLRLKLEPHWVADYSGNDGWRLERVLTGSAAMGQRWSLEQENHSLP